MRKDQSAALDAALSKEAIREVLAAYIRSVDRADEQLMRNCYHPDAIEEHAGMYHGNAHEYIGLTIPRLRTMGAMQHFMGSSSIDLDGNQAWVETYMLTFVRLFEADGNIDAFTGGRLLDRFERRHGQWKIAHRRIVLEWNRDTASNEGWCAGRFDPEKAGVYRGKKDFSDPSYERF